jgi:hypothetical protein
MTQLDLFDIGIEHINYSTINPNPPKCLIIRFTNKQGTTTHLRYNGRQEKNAYKAWSRAPSHLTVIW